MSEVVLISGAARGIGLATARAFADRGAKVVLCDLDEAVHEAAGSVAGSRGELLDVTQPEAWTAVVERTERELGPIEVLVNNAGIMHLGTLLSQPAIHDRQQIEVNLMGPLHGIRAALPKMIERGRGTVVNVASVAGHVAPPGAAVYAATKHAVVGLTEGLRLEIEGSGVHLVCVCPGPVNTVLYAGAKRLSWPPLIEPTDVAKAIVGAVTKAKPEVFVPAVSVIGSVLPRLLPRRLTAWIGRAMGAQDMFLQVDQRARARYIHRISED